MAFDQDAGSAALLCGPQAPKPAAGSMRVGLLTARAVGAAAGWVRPGALATYAAGLAVRFGRTALEAPSIGRRREHCGPSRAVSLPQSTAPAAGSRSRPWFAQAGFISCHLGLWGSVAVQQRVPFLVRGFADKRWDSEAGDVVAEAVDAGSAGVSRGGSAGLGSGASSNPIHPHGLNVPVFNGNVDLAMRKLRRKVIAEGVKKKFQNLRVSAHRVTPLPRPGCSRACGPSLAGV